MRPFIPIYAGARGKRRRPLILLTGYLVCLALVILMVALVFQRMMLHYEGLEYSLVNGLYWTITTMSTLGFGDITFVSHAGRLFSGFVTISGIILLHVLLPFGIISVIFGPWLERRLRYRPTTEVARKMTGHVIICGWDPVTQALAKRLAAAGVPYVALAPEIDEARRLEEEAISVIYGRPSDAQALVRARVEAARMVIANCSDPENANIALTVASISNTPVATVLMESSRADLLALAGAAHTVPLREILGDYLAVRATTKGARSHVVDSLGDLLFAETASHGTPFVGLSLRDADIRRRTGTSVVGIWQRGRFTIPRPETEITDNMVMLLVGTAADLEALEELSAARTSSEEFVIIAGHGSVGSAAAAYLAHEGVPHVIIDREETAAGRPGFVRGDASDQGVLEQAGILRARGLIVTTNDDGTNVFLTLAARHVNPHMRIVSRANREENVDELYAAGADFVVSLSSVGASILSNMIEGRQTSFLTEGVHIFWRPVPASLAGRTLAESNLRSTTGATVVAIQRDPSTVNLDLRATTILERGATLILVGNAGSEEVFSKRFR